MSRPRNKLQKVVNSGRYFEVARAGGWIFFRWRYLFQPGNRADSTEG
jgi:hypothetical protein